MFKVLIALLMIPSLLFAAGGGQTGSPTGGGGVASITAPGAGSGSATTVTEVSVSVSTIAANMVPALPNRSSCIIENRGNFNLHISFAGAATTLSKIVYPGDHFSCFAAFGFVPVGAISGISASGLLDVLVVQATK